MMSWEGQQLMGGSAIVEKLVVRQFLEETDVVRHYRSSKSNTLS